MKLLALYNQILHSDLILYCDFRNIAFKNKFISSGSINELEEVICTYILKSLHHLTL